jgi:hypothetical protein
MNEPDLQPPGLQILRTTVYFDASTGVIVHVHRIAAAAGDELDDARIEEEAAIFEESLERRHGRQLDRITVDEETLQEAASPAVNLRVDIATRTVVRDDPER